MDPVFAQDGDDYPWVAEISVPDRSELRSRASCARRSLSPTTDTVRATDLSRA